MTEARSEGWFCQLSRDGDGNWKMEMYLIWHMDEQLLSRCPERRKPAIAVSGCGRHISVTCERFGPRDEVLKDAERDLVLHMRDWLAACAADLDKAYPPVSDGGDAPG